MQVITDPKVKVLASAQVQQAFLPKFENEGQDTQVADAIVEQVCLHSTRTPVDFAGLAAAASVCA